MTSPVGKKVTPTLDAVFDARMLEDEIAAVQLLIDLSLKHKHDSDEKPDYYNILDDLVNHLKGQYLNSWGKARVGHLHEGRPKFKHLTELLHIAIDEHVLLVQKRNQQKKDEKE